MGERTAWHRLGSPICRRKFDFLLFIGVGLGVVSDQIASPAQLTGALRVPAILSAEGRHSKTAGWLF
jgi:hypothetical protein